MASGASGAGMVDDVVVDGGKVEVGADAMFVKTGLEVDVVVNTVLEVLVREGA
jgi:hypothetical protein